VHHLEDISDLNFLGIGARTLSTGRSASPTAFQVGLEATVSVAEPGADVAAESAGSGADRAMYQIQEKTRQIPTQSTLSKRAGERPVDLEPRCLLADRDRPR
jgi:hypothetical protein